LRWFFTFLVVALLLGFAYFVWPEPFPERHLVAIPIWATDRLAVAPPPYAREDIDKLAQITDVQFHGSLGLQDAGSFASLGAELGQLVKNKESVLIVHLCAHGASDAAESGDGTGYVICSDYMRTPEGGRYPVGNLLRDVESSPAELKLLVLDSGRIAYDPRLGIIANEFPRLVEDELKKLSEQELWVLLPNSPMERAAVAHPLRQSVFGLSITEALSGEADLPPNDRFITLHELYRYVFLRCTGWFAPDTGARQTPLLMKAGVGLIRPTEQSEGDKEHRLAWIEAEEPADDEQDEDKPGEQETDKPTDDASEALGEPAENQEHYAHRTRRILLRGTHPAQISIPSVFVATAGAEAQEESAAAAPAAEKGSDSPTAAKAAPDEKMPLGPAEDPEDAKTDDPATPAATKENEPESAEDLDQFDLDVERLRTLVHQAWRLRDAIQNPAGPAASSPAEFAPHLWREVNAILLFYEQRCRTGRPIESQGSGGGTSDQSLKRLTDSLTALAEDLRMLQDLINDGTSSSAAEYRMPLCARIAKSWERHRRQLQTVGSETKREPSKLREVRSIARQHNRLLFLARDYVRWYAQASITGSHSDQLREKIDDFLDGLLRFREALDDLQATPIEPDEQDRLDAALKRFQALLNLQGEVDRLVLGHENAILDEDQRPFQEQQIEDLLSTPLLPAPRRQRLLGRLLDGELRINAAPLAKEELPNRITLSVPPAQWQRLRERLQLEEELIRLTDADQADTLQAQISRIEKLTGELPATEEPLWSECRKTGAALREFYTNAPADADYYALHLIDPRDTPKVARNHPFATFSPTVKVSSVLNLAGPTQLRLEKDEPRAVTCTLSATKRHLLDHTPKLAYDDAFVRMTGGPEDGLFQSGDGWFRKTLTWHFLATADQEESGASEADLELTVNWSDGADAGQARHKISLVLPQPNRIDLEVIRVGAAKHKPDDGSTVGLELYPNRKTQYQFTLVNKSGVERQVEVSLYAILPKRSSTVAPGRIDRQLQQAVLDEVTGILPGARLIAKTSASVQLRSDSTRHEPINFVAPGAANESKPADDAESKPKAAPKPPETSPAVDVSYGLVCVITDAADASERWFKWIELTPIAPNRFLQPDIAYDYDTGRIVTRFVARDFDDDGKSDLPIGVPVSIVWNDYKGEIPQDAESRLSGPFNQTSSELELYAAVPPDNETRTVSLDVDGYPRAVVFQVPCNREPPASRRQAGSDIRRTDRRIRMNSLLASNHPVKFHFAPFVNFPSPKELEEDKKLRHVKIAPNEQVVVPAPCRAIEVNFETDAPADAFENADHKVEIVLGDELIEPSRFYADRSMTTGLVKFGENGLVEFETVVGDYSVQLEPGDLANKKTYVEAELLLPGIGQATDHVLLVLDSDTPVIQKADVLVPDRRGPARATRTPVDIPKGARPIVRVHAKDLSGIAQVEYALSSDGSRILHPESSTKTEPKNVRSIDATHVFDFELDTAKLDPEQYVLLIRLTDKAGHQSEVLSQELRIAMSAKKPLKGVIAGQIVFGQNRAPVNGVLFNATLKGPKIGAKPVEIKADGTFSIKDLPPGPYAITAQGSFQGREAVGTVEDIEPSPSEKPAPITVTVDRRKPKKKDET